MVECADGREAIRLYRELRPDVVLMDISMEGVDGIAATRAIRESDPGARVVMVTEHGEPEFRRAAAAAGASGYVLKDQLLELPTVLRLTSP